MSSAAKTPLKIVMIASECVPYAKTGGLADVVGALPQMLKALGHEVIVIIPKYSAINAQRHGLRRFWDTLGVWMGNDLEWCAVDMADNRGVTTYFIESHKHFSRPGYYHDADCNDYRDNAQRFGFLTRAGLQLCHDLGFAPDIVHVHDWQTALAPGYLKIWHWDDPILSQAASVLTIHNIAYQGKYHASAYDYLGLQWGNFTADKFEDYGAINFLKGGIQYADAINTVSPTYADETRTPAMGYGMAPFLNDRGDSYWGILNGVDYTEWDPSTDRLIPARYSASDISGKAICKRELQKRFQLTEDAKTPIIGVISRLVSQKGLELLAEKIEEIVDSMQAQFTILGSGDKGLESFFGALPTRYAGRIGSHIGYDNEIAHCIEAGADFFVMPSLYEPCGLNQLYSLRYGTLPIVRATGGLNDTVQQYDESSGGGTGFKFWDPSALALSNTIGWALSTYFDRPQHMRQMIKAAMSQNFPGESTAQAYVRLYEHAVAKKKAGARP
ncbi:MAG: glycogen synthase GlgA [Opitutaceae bacterium]|jgi:starch synthase